MVIECIYIIIWPTKVNQYHLEGLAKYANQLKN